MKRGRGRPRKRKKEGGEHEEEEEERAVLEAEELHDEEEQHQACDWDFGGTGQVLDDSAQTEAAILLLASQRDAFVKFPGLALGSVGLTDERLLSSEYFVVLLSKASATNKRSVRLQCEGSRVVHASEAFLAARGLSAAAVVGASPRVLQIGPGFCATTRELNCQRLTGLPRGVRFWTQMAFFASTSSARLDVRLRCFLLVAQHLPRFMVVSVLPKQETDRPAPQEAVVSCHEDWWQALPDVDVDFLDDDWDALLPAGGSFGL